VRPNFLSALSSRQRGLQQRLPKFPYVLVASAKLGSPSNFKYTADIYVTTYIN
jgi:hypothetical protein